MTENHTLAEAVHAASAILFDFFHTLSAIETANAPLPKESWEILGLEREAWYRAWHALGRARVLGQVVDPYRMLAEPARVVDPAVAERLIEAAVRSRREKFANAMRHVAPDVLDTLVSLRHRGKKLGLVSNADYLEIAAWPQSPLKPLFDVAIFSCEVGCAKPDPDIYLRACHALGVDPRECLFVGDGGTDELAGAKRLGMTTVQMTGILARFWPERVAERGVHADHVIADLRALLPASPQ